MTSLDEALAAPDGLMDYCLDQSSSGWPDGAAIAAGLAEAVARHWPAEDLRSIAEYARTRAARAELAMPPLYAEAVLRAAGGETELLLGIPRDYHLSWSVCLLALLTADEREQ